MRYTPASQPASRVEPGTQRQTLRRASRSSSSQSAHTLSRSSRCSVHLALLSRWTVPSIGHGLNRCRVRQIQQRSTPSDLAYVHTHLHLTSLDRGCFQHPSASGKCHLISSCHKTLLSYNAALTPAGDPPRLLLEGAKCLRSRSTIRRSHPHANRPGASPLREAAINTSAY